MDKSPKPEEQTSSSSIDNFFDEELPEQNFFQIHGVEHEQKPQ